MTSRYANHRVHSAAAGRNLKNLQEAAEDAEKSDIILLSLLILRPPVPKSCQNYTIPQVCNTENTEFIDWKSKDKR